MTVSNIEDLRQQARRKMPRMFFDYLDGGAFSERTLARNTEDFDQWTLEQRVLVDLSKRNLSSEILGCRYSMPVMLAPVGFAGSFWPDGEVEAARAATEAGIPMCLSTFSINSIEEVGAAMPHGLAMQLYVFKDRELASELIQRAWKVGVTTLFLTADTNVSSVRERDTRNGFRTSSSLKFGTLVDLLSHPAWCIRMGLHGRLMLGNVKGKAGVPRSLMAQAAYLSGNVDPSMSWADLEWLRGEWPGKLVVKGVLSVEDASRALDGGADGVCVSNHGGRQLDGARSSISVLPEIAQFIAGRAEVLLDSGIRRGSHIIKAIGLGADAVLLGRAYAYGLGASGRAGVSQAIELLRKETELTLALMGMCSIDELRANRDAVRRCYSESSGSNRLDVERLLDGIGHTPISSISD
ncbi:alpha-hydroxy acid oxidase [Paraburkholderia sp. DHOC27]|uniref:alpha-hydroxy acid oxidase n=1 Tax=Paraburkholderia sp. DHOC27 TaxID=2303330 RepID=UPI000E3B7D78|nr:alpha-hydroxy acid oxidase [Paraburkholderia sp. DHOC27]RFU49766.1 alpha-hydroxy-acid oxidizing protein [Paraburkholderia sp. DHOC27]